MFKYWVNGYWCDSISEADKKADGRHDVWKVPKDKLFRNENGTTVLNGTLAIRWRTMR